MDQIFAPWRIEWVEREGNDVDGCVFCELPERGDDRENLIVAESQHAFVLLNNYPYNPGHAMVIPRTHTGEYCDLDDEVLLDHARMKARTFEAMEVALDPDGFNAGLNLGQGSGGSIDDHLHTHVVPRWEGDTNFMPVVGETNVIVEAIDDTYERLHGAFAEMDQASAAGSDSAVHLDFRHGDES
ncbi:MAG: HIT domain-containing protein [Halanaeroarchaeum sp.]